MAEQCVSTEVAVVQPLLSRQAGHGDTDGTDSNRHRGESCLSSPATTPYMRVRIRRFGGLS
jgi:hypothetical protein